MDQTDAVRRLRERRDFLRKAVAGTAIVALGGGLYRLAGDDLTREARAQRRSDGRPRLPPGQRVLEELKPMGGQPGSSRLDEFRLRLHGLVDTPMTLGFEQLLALERVEQIQDVHCVTGWSVLGARWKGVRLSTLAKLAGVKPEARHVIIQGAHGYTANVPLAEALVPACMVAYRLNGKALAKSNGAPVRAVIPDLYFWKSSKWLTGLRFVGKDEPGYWEVRGYHNHGDPWREQRHSS